MYFTVCSPLVGTVMRQRRTRPAGEDTLGVRAAARVVREDVRSGHTDRRQDGDDGWSRDVGGAGRREDRPVDGAVRELADGDSGPGAGTDEPGEQRHRL